MPELPSQIVKEGIKSLRKGGMLEWSYGARPKHSPEDHVAQEDAGIAARWIYHAHADDRKNIIRSSTVALLCRLVLVIGEAVNEFDSLIPLGTVGSQSNRWQLATHEHQKPRALQVEVETKKTWLADPSQYFYPGTYSYCVFCEILCLWIMYLAMEPTL